MYPCVTSCHDNKRNRNNNCINYRKFNRFTVDG